MEFYGYDGRPNPDVPEHDSFGTFVAPINDLLAQHESKPILVRGTCTGDGYYPYVTSLRQARYCYGCYLIGRTGGSAFSFGQDFQITRLPYHRTNGTTLFSYFELVLGDPAGPAVHNQSGGWSRAYTGGAVFVTAAAAGVTSQTWTAAQSWWTTRGNKVSVGTPIVVEPGDAAILLRDRPPPPAEFVVDLQYAANEYLVEGATGEWLVESVTGEYRYQNLILTVRSTDPSSAVLVRFETDDRAASPYRPFGILTILPVKLGFDPGNNDYPYGQNSPLAAVHVTYGKYYPTDGTSNGLKINLALACKPFECYRVMSVRAIGSVTVEGIRLTSPTPIAGV